MTSFECKDCDKKCNLCKYTCRRNRDLARHIKIIHLKIKDFKCFDCKYSCSTKNNLNRHIKMVHSKIKDFNCPDCKYSCSIHSHLKQHIKMVHLKIKDFKCKECPYTSSCKSNLKTHMKTCTGIRKITSGEMCVINGLIDLDYVENVDFVYDSTYQPLTNFSGKNLRFDIRFVNFKIAIEYDGKQHFEPVCFGGITKEQADNQFLKTLENDRLKNVFCEENEYKLIRIPYNKKHNILNILTEHLADIEDFEFKPSDSI